MPKINELISSLKELDLVRKQKNEKLIAIIQAFEEVKNNIPEKYDDKLVKILADITSKFPIKQDPGNQAFMNYCEKLLASAPENENQHKGPARKK